MASVSCVPYALMWCVPAAHTGGFLCSLKYSCKKKKHTHQIRIMPLTLAAKRSEDWGTEIGGVFIIIGQQTAAPIMLMTVAWLSHLWQTPKSKNMLLAELLWNMKLFEKRFPNDRLTHLSGCLGRGRKSCNILWADVYRSQCRISLQSANGTNNKQ